MAKMTKHGGGIGAPTREERMREAASLHIKTGNIQRYCELMVEMGQVGVLDHGGGIGAPTREERMREAASLHIKTGNIQRYCELMVEMGQVILMPIT